MITFKDFVFSTDYTNPEKHISASIYNDNHDKNPYDDFVDIDVNIKNLIKYEKWIVTDIWAESAGKLSILLQDPTIYKGQQLYQL